MREIKRFFACFLGLLLLAMPVISAFGGQRTGAYERDERLSPSELLSLLTGEELTEAELAYVNRYYDGELLYNAALPGELILREEGQWSAAPYTTKTQDGASILWTAEG